MAHSQQNVARETTTETRKKTTGGLTPWRESLVKQLILERLGETVEVTELARAWPFRAAISPARSSAAPGSRLRTGFATSASPAPSN
jgi:hypothetical protein